MDGRTRCPRPAPQRRPWTYSDAIWPFRTDLLRSLPPVITASPHVDVRSITALHAHLPWHLTLSLNLPVVYPLIFTDFLSQSLSALPLPISSLSLPSRWTPSTVQSRSRCRLHSLASSKRTPRKSSATILMTSPSSPESQHADASTATRVVHPYHHQLSSRRSGSNSLTSFSLLDLSVHPPSLLSYFAALSAGSQRHSSFSKAQLSCLHCTAYQLTSY